MAVGWQYEFRVWRTVWDEKGYAESELKSFPSKQAAQGQWRSWKNGPLPFGCKRGHVSAVQVWRRPADGLAAQMSRWESWTPALSEGDGSCELRLGFWPKWEPQAEEDAA